MGFLRRMERRHDRETARAVAHVLDPLLRRVLGERPRRDVHDLYDGCRQTLRQAATDPNENAEAIRLVTTVWTRHGIDAIARAIRRGAILVGPAGELSLRGSTPARVEAKGTNHDA